MTWTVDRLDTGEVHVAPLFDAIEHALHDDCHCGPSSEAVPGDDGYIGWMYTHHSLDGREQHEGVSGVRSG